MENVIIKLYKSFCLLYVVQVHRKQKYIEELDKVKRRATKNTKSRNQCLYKE